MRTLLLGTSMLVLSAGGAPALQDEAANLTPLKLELVVSRLQEGEKATDTPYKLYVTANGDSTYLRTGREVPIAVAKLPAPSSEPTEELLMTSYQYRNVGMNVTCRVFSHDERFRIKLQLERSSFFEGADSSSDHPSFRTFNSELELLLADGQTAEIVAGSDPLTKESWAVEVTLQVLK